MSSSIGPRGVPQHIIRVAALATALGTGLAQAEPLTSEDAVRLALARDTTATALGARAEATRERASADGALPDPELLLGVENLPTGSFALDAEPMSMVTLGVRQRFPVGRAAEQSAGLARAGAGEAEVALRRRELAREVRSRVADLIATETALTLAREERALVEPLVAARTAALAAGRSSQAEVITTRLMLGEALERVLRLEAERDTLRADLTRLIGREGAAPFTFAELSVPPTTERARLSAHPALAASEQLRTAALADVDAARARYRPGWMLELRYGARSGRDALGMPRDDMVSAMVGIELPLFPGRRQDRRVSAANAEVRIAEAEHETRVRELDARLTTAAARQARLMELETLYRDSLLPDAATGATVTTASYAAGDADFAATLAARRADLTLRARLAAVTAERRALDAELAFLLGDTP